MINYILNLFSKKEKERKLLETKDNIIQKETKIKNKNGRLFFEIIIEDLEKINKDIYFHESLSAWEMLNKGVFSHQRSFIGRKYKLVLIPVTEIENPKERSTKSFIQISQKDYGEKSVNMVIGYLAPTIAKIISPEELTENKVKTIVIPHKAIPDLDENNLFLVETGKVNEKNILTSWESYGPRGDYNIWEEEGIYLVFVISED